MKTSGALVAVMLMMMPLASASAWTLDVEIGRAEVKTKGFDAQFVADMEAVARIPSFSRNVRILSVGVTTDTARIPWSASLFASDSDRFVRNYGGPPPLPNSGNGTPSLTVDHSVSAHGFRIGLSPVRSLGDSWALDGSIGVQHMRTRLGYRPGLVGSPRKRSDTSPFAGVGVSYYFTPQVGFRLGVDVADDYRALTIGVRYEFD